MTLANDKEAFDKILTLAEELQEKAERGKNRLAIIRFIEIVFLVSLPLFVYFLYIQKIIYIDSSVMIFAATIIAIYISALELIILKKINMTYNRDLRALYEVLEVLRELGGYMKDKGVWSDLERLNFRIRLTRFGIDDNIYFERKKARLEY